MPVFIIGLIVVSLFVLFALFYFKKNNTHGENRGLNIIIFALSLFSFIISLKLFWNMGIYADEKGSSPVLVSGGWFWLSMDWVRLGLLFVLCLITGLRLKKTPGKKKPGSSEEKPGQVIE